MSFAYGTFVQHAKHPHLYGFVVGQAPHSQLTKVYRVTDAGPGVGNWMTQSLVPCEPSDEQLTEFVAWSLTEGD